MVAISFLGQQNLPRGLRNNNPGNLVITGIAWQGKIPVSQNTDGQFEQFTSLQYGIRAMAMDIINDVRNNNYSLTQLIHEYAPPFENNTQSYINQVAAATGINPNAPLQLSTDSLQSILYAMMKIENGPQAVMQHVPYTTVRDSIFLLPQTLLADLQQYITENPKKSAAGALLLLASIYGAYKIFTR